MIPSPQVVSNIRWLHGRNQSNNKAFTSFTIGITSLRDTLQLKKENNSRLFDFFKYIQIFSLYSNKIFDQLLWMVYCIMNI